MFENTVFICFMNIDIHSLSRRLSYKRHLYKGSYWLVIETKSILVVIETKSFLVGLKIVLGSEARTYVI